MSAPGRLLLEGTTDDPLVVVRSSTWAFNTIGLFSADEACVVDPGLSRSDVDLLSWSVCSRDHQGAGRQVTHVLLTHAHQDHIRGWMRFPGSEITFPRVAAEKGDVARSRILAAKAKFDRHLDDEDPAFRYPEPTQVFDECLHLRVGDLEIEQRFLPGHSNCTSVVWIPALKTLLSADYLVTPGMPYCRWKAREFERAIETLIEWTETEDIRRIVPAHQAILEGPEAILAALAAERDYMITLRQEVRARLDEGCEPESGVRQAAKAMVARRGSNLGGRRQDLDNARRVWTEESDARPDESGAGARSDG